MNSVLIATCLFSFLCVFINAQQTGDAISLNAPNCGLRPLISSRNDQEPSKIVGGT